MLNNIINMAINGTLKNHPMMSMFNQYMGGKTPQQQIQTLINMAQNKGIDINKVLVTKQDLAKLGFKLPN